MAKKHPISDLVDEARILTTLDKTPPPMKFHADFNIPEISAINPQAANEMSSLLQNTPAPS